MLDQEDQEPSTMSGNQNDSMDDDLPNARSTNTDSIQPRKTSKVITEKWEVDPTISQLSATFVENLQEEQEKICKGGEDMEEVTQYKAPTDATEIQQQQKIHISLRKARNSDSQPTLKLFKSFAHSLRQSDPTLALLPINATKQNLPA